VLAESMHHLARDTTTYIGNQAGGDSTNFYGNVYGDVNFPARPREAGEPSPSQCLRDLRVTDPREDRARIEGDKDRLLRDCYAWILDNATFQQWRTQVESRLLWIRGDPGKGKTMMTMGLIAELSQRPKPSLTSRTMSKIKTKFKLSSQPCLVTYFFCQSTQPMLNNAVSVLRGLIYLLVEQREQLMRHVQKRYEVEGSALFDGPNAVHALREILSAILNDPTLPTTYLLVDALDECGAGLSSLLLLITDNSLTRRSKVKWLVTSRNEPDIERYLEPDPAGMKVSLEVSAEQVSRAVAAFINFKVQGLATVKKYDDLLQAEVQLLLRDKAEGTFLWVSLVCKELEYVPLYLTRKVLQAMPPGLVPLYERMMAQILAQKNGTTVEYCKNVLRAVTVAFRPLRLEELVVAASLPSDQFDNAQTVTDLTIHCGSFVTVQRNIVSFVHLSAKDYFLESNGSRHIFAGAIAKEHEQVAHRLLDVMRNTLRRDLCGLEKSRTQTLKTADQIKQSILTRVAYACEYWVDHLCESTLAIPASFENALQDQGAIDEFLREKFLYWLEALSLCKSVSKGLFAIDKLLTLVQVYLQHLINHIILSLILAREEKERAGLYYSLRMHIDLSCTIEERSRLALFKYMHQHYYSVQKRA
jgi:hypothetical protein